MSYGGGGYGGGRGGGGGGYSNGNGYDLFDRYDRGPRAHYDDRDYSRG